MKKSSLLSGIIAILIALVLGFSVMSCTNSNDNDGNKENVGGNNGGNVEEVVPADKTALNAEIALEVSEQGDYTADSYNAYRAKLDAAKTVANDTAATQEAVDKATADLTAARGALTIRPIEEVKGAKKEFKVISGREKEIVLADYVNVNGLSKITYKVQSSSDVLTVSAINDGKFTLTAGEVNGEAVVKVSINVYYDNNAKMSLVLSVKVTNDIAPVLFDEEITDEYDLFTLANKESIIIDFAENIDNPGNLTLAYSVKCDDEELVLNGSKYTFTFGTYTDDVVYKTFTVTVKK